MTEKVDSAEIEGIVGVKRHNIYHVAKAVSAEQKVYILHPFACLDLYGADLTECPWSLALDEGINPCEWREDVPVLVTVCDGELVPGGPAKATS